MILPWDDKNMSSYDYYQTLANELNFSFKWAIKWLAVKQISQTNVYAGVRAASRGSYFP